MKKEKIIQVDEKGAEMEENKDFVIVDAFDEILNAACHAELKEEELDKAAGAFEYITRRLSITRMQALIISMLIDFNDGLHTKNMASFLSISNIKFLRHIDELENLVERKIVRKGKDHGDKSFYYEIRDEAQQAYMRNEVFVPRDRSGLSTQQFIETVNDMFDKCDMEQMSKRELQTEVNEMTSLNKNLEMCKLLENLSVYQQIFFYYCVTKYVYEYDLSISTMEVSDYTNPLFVRKLANMLNEGKDELITNKLIRNGGESDFNDKNSFTVSDEIQELLVCELGLQPVMKKSDATKGLKLHADIPVKKLFYNPAESRSISELTSILSVDKFDGVQKRLEKHGMRKGFACLFYGLPGTGKTESVLQIARATGRDIMEVNVTDIKSKWVGDSEKNVRQIFDRYRRYCKECEVMPILLFNEADAIIGKRCTNVERSVDKMENALQNIILEEMEKLDGILIATTNLTSNMDSAFERRFLYKVEFKKPTVDIKVRIWQAMMPQLSYEDARALAEEYDFSGGQIENIVRKDIINNILYDEDTTLDELCRYCDDELLKDNTRRCNRIGF